MTKHANKVMNDNNLGVYCTWYNNGVPEISNKTNSDASYLHI